ncbi:MAG: hypothetical protein RL701_1907 [Pseudomonadota bacterium]|jgi:hypothetical protein
MSSRTPGAEAPIQYTKESLVGLRDAWVSYAAKQISIAAAALEQAADKLPAAVKSKLPKKSKIQSDAATSGANAPS